MFETGPLIRRPPMNAFARANPSLKHMMIPGEDEDEMSDMHYPMIKVSIRCSRYWNWRNLMRLGFTYRQIQNICRLKRYPKRIHVSIQ